MTTILKPPTANDEEDALVAGLMAEPRLMFDVSQIVTPENFYQVVAGQVFDAMLRIASAGKNPDLLTIAGDIASRGGSSEQATDYILRVMTNHSMTPGAGFDLTEYARRVKAFSKRRRALNAASTIARMAYDPATPVEETIRYMQGAGLEVAGLNDEAQTTTEAAGEWYSDFEQMIEAGKAPGLRTGIVEFDRAALLQAPRFVIFAAPPGGGKSTMMKRIAVSVAQIERRPVAVFTLEMNKVEYIRMIAAEVAGVDVSPAILKLHPDDRRAGLAKVKAAMSKIYGMTDTTLFIDDSPNITPAEIAFKCQAIKARMGDLALIVVDYAQLVTPDRTSRDGTRQDEVASVSRALKALAKSMRVPVVAGSQLNDQGQVRESRALNQDADALVMMTPDTGSLEIKITKFRQGATDQFVLRFDKKLSRIANFALPADSEEASQYAEWTGNKDIEKVQL